MSTRQHQENQTNQEQKDEGKPNRGNTSSAGTGLRMLVNPQQDQQPAPKSSGEDELLKPESVVPGFSGRRNDLAAFLPVAASFHPIDLFEPLSSSSRVPGNTNFPAEGAAPENSLVSMISTEETQQAPANLVHRNPTMQSFGIGGLNAVSTKQPFDTASQISAIPHPTSAPVDEAATRNNEHQVQLPSVGVPSSSGHQYVGLVPPSASQSLPLLQTAVLEPTHGGPATDAAAAAASLSFAINQSAGATTPGSLAEQAQMESRRQSVKTPSELLLSQLLAAASSNPSSVNTTSPPLFDHHTHIQDDGAAAVSSGGWSAMIERFSQQQQEDDVSEGAPEMFPMTLHRLLMDLEQIDGGQDIGGFVMPHGRSFIILDPQKFESEIMPKYFPRMNRFASFQRQLNLYNFSRVGGSGAERGAYHHALFVRDQPSAARRMRRTKIKGLFKIPKEKRRKRKPGES